MRRRLRPNVSTPCPACTRNSCRPGTILAGSVSGKRSVEVAPGCHIYSASHTLARFETAFYEPIVSDWQNFESWQDSGSLTATQRANTVW
ncbi:MAG: trimethylamine methyltransferase family protein, partial [Acidobacteria bacterium]|nr:trimethylamine methyltransferase family protein [Acidobacteriota bacterium]